jgi:hypothetical protein
MSAGVRTSVRRPTSSSVHVHNSQGNQGQWASLLHTLLLGLGGGPSDEGSDELTLKARRAARGLCAKRIDPTTRRIQHDQDTRTPFGGAPRVLGLCRGVEAKIRALHPLRPPCTFLSLRRPFGFVVGVPSGEGRRGAGGQARERSRRGGMRWLHTFAGAVCALLAVAGVTGFMPRLPRAPGRRWVRPCTGVMCSYADSWTCDVRERHCVGAGVRHIR